MDITGYPLGAHIGCPLGPLGCPLGAHTGCPLCRGRQFLADIRVHVYGVIFVFGNFGRVTYISFFAILSNDLTVARCLLLFCSGGDGMGVRPSVLPSEALRSFPRF